MVEGARLERVYAGNRIKGSNPFLSASYSRVHNGDASAHFYGVSEGNGFGLIGFAGEALNPLVIAPPDPACCACVTMP